MSTLGNAVIAPVPRALEALRTPRQSHPWTGVNSKGFRAGGPRPVPAQTSLSEPASPPLSSFRLFSN